MSSLSRTLSRRAARDQGKLAPHPHEHRHTGLRQAKIKRRERKKIARISRRINRKRNDV